MLAGLSLLAATCDLSEPDAVLRLESAACELPLREIYERVDFEDDPDSADVPGRER